MEIKTKYNLNEKVWTIDNNHIVCFEIKCIQFMASNFSDVAARSTVYAGDHTETVHREEDCYPTREGLIDAIK